MFQGRLVQQNSKLEVIGLLTSDRKLRIQTKAPARVVSTLIPITGQHEKRPIGKVAILVDGMEVDATFDPVSEVVSKSPNATRVSAYLIQASSLTGVLSRVGTYYETVLWNGDIFDKVAVRNAIDQLKCRILDLADVKVDLVTHSYGTIIAYAALQELAEAIPRNCSIPNAGKYEIDNFVTFASPLGRDEFIVSWFGAFPAITIPKLNDILEPRSLKIQGRWLNFYHSTDCIGGKIDRPFIEDFSYNQDLVVLGPDCGPAHTYSFQDANPLRKLWEELRKSEGTP